MMNGPSPKGESMPKKQAPSWSESDKDLGEKFLKEMPAYDGGFLQIKDKIARSLGYKQGYMEMPEGVRSYMAHVGQQGKQKKKNFLIEQRVDMNLAQMKKDFEDLYKNDPSFKHAKTHPDEEEAH